MEGLGQSIEELKNQHSLESFVPLLAREGEFQWLLAIDSTEIGMRRIYCMLTIHFSPLKIALGGASELISLKNSGTYTAYSFSNSGCTCAQVVCLLHKCPFHLPAEF